VLAAWGSQRHWQILRSIKLSECPRCTYAPHNALYEEFLDPEDQVCKDFI